MTEIETIDLDIKAWQELVDDFPKAKEKLSMWDKIKDMKSNCLCCEFYRCCEECPLWYCICNGFNEWKLYIYNKEGTYQEAKKGAENILRLLKEYRETLGPAETGDEFRSYVRKK